MRPNSVIVSTTVFAQALPSAFFRAPSALSIVVSSGARREFWLSWVSTLPVSRLTTRGPVGAASSVPAIVASVTRSPAAVLSVVLRIWLNKARSASAAFVAGPIAGSAAVSASNRCASIGFICENGSGA